MGATMNIRWNRTTPAKTLAMLARETLAPPMSRAAMENMPTCSWLL